MPRSSESRLRLLGRLGVRRSDAGSPRSSVADRVSPVLLEITPGSGDEGGMEVDVYEGFEGIKTVPDETDKGLPESELTGRREEGRCVG